MVKPAVKESMKAASAEQVATAEQAAAEKAAEKKHPAPRAKIGSAEPKKTVSVTIDRCQVSVPENATILEAAKSAGINIPTLCYLKDLNEIGACRICIVEIEGIEQLVASCNNVVLDGMVIHTNSPRVREARKANLEFLLSRHSSNCTSCVRSGNCSLQSLSNQFGISELPYKVELGKTDWPQDFPLVRDANKCIHCLRCIQVCDHIQNVGVWDLSNRSSHTCVGVKGGAPITETGCTLCGQCITHCPTGALRERDDTDRVFNAIADPEKTVVVQIAPAVRAAWGESLGLSKEEATVERMATALRALGIDYVFDTSFAADLTIMEEGSEFLAKLGNANDASEKFPLFTSCCPGWVRYAKSKHPEIVDQLSSAKSPGQMFGAVAKSYFAEILDVDPKNMFVVEIMPCLAKKSEVAIPAMNDACGEPDVDISLTVREMNRMFNAACLDVASLEEGELDQPLGTYTGAGVIFGATGGVMEAALRTAHVIATGEDVEADAFKDVRGQDGWKEATFDMDGKPLRVAIAHGLANAEKLVTALNKGEVAYDFVEVMACPGGCVGGGGQPIHDGEELAEKRGEVLWDLDKKSKLRKSHLNPAIQAAYKDYLGEPLSHKAHKLLHTDHHSWQMPAEKKAAKQK